MDEVGVIDLTAETFADLEARVREQWPRVEAYLRSLGEDPDAILCEGARKLAAWEPWSFNLTAEVPHQHEGAYAVQVMQHLPNGEVQSVFSSDDADLDDVMQAAQAWHIGPPDSDPQGGLTARGPNGFEMRVSGPGGRPLDQTLLDEAGAALADAITHRMARARRSVDNAEREATTGQSQHWALTFETARRAFIEFEGDYEEVEHVAYQCGVRTENYADGAYYSPPTIGPFGSGRFVLRAAPKPVSAQLVAVHNLRADSLLHAQEVGGLIAPSIAVIKAGMAFDNFGDITLVAPLSLVDPKSTPVFDADVYSPRYPTVRFKPNYKEIAKFTKEFHDYVQRTESYVSDAEQEVEKSGGEGLLRRESLPALQLAFLEQVKGMKIDAPTRAKPLQIEWARAPSMKQFYETQGPPTNKGLDDPYWQAYSEAAARAIQEHTNEDGLDEEERAHLRQLQQKEHTYDNRLNMSSGDQLWKSYQNIGQTETDKYEFRDQLDELIKPFKAEFEAWAAQRLKPLQGDRYLPYGSRKLPYTPENVLKLMTPKKLQGEEGFNYGLGSLRALGAKKFRSLDQMAADADKLVSKEEMEQHKESIDKRFWELAEELKAYHPASDSFRFTDAVLSAIGESYKRGKSLSAEMTKDGFKGIPSDLLREVDQFRKDLVNLPTEYFEAKPQRIVPLNEFVGAVVPKDASTRILDVLKSNGLAVSTYNRAKPETRAKALAKLLKTSKTAAAKDARGCYEFDLTSAVLPFRIENALKPLHPAASLSQAKLQELERLTTEQLVQSLAPGTPNSLKVRRDGTIMEGNHRVHVLRNRGVDVDQLPYDKV